jgi:glucose/arabinose dehydrogenase
MTERSRWRGAALWMSLLTSACGSAANNAPPQVVADNARNETLAPKPPASASAPPTQIGASAQPLVGEAANGDWTTDRPGVRRKLSLRDLPAPYATNSSRNHPDDVSAPPGAMPAVPAGFAVQKFAEKLAEPRMLRSAPNGDVFVAESTSDRVRVLRDADGDGKAELSEVFAKGLNRPFGIAFYPPGPKPTHVYIANTDSVVRFVYASGDTAAHKPAEMIVCNLPGGGLLEGGGHWTRDVVFAPDGSKMFVSVGSHSNLDDDDKEARRARIFEYTPDGKNERVYAYGIRNAVGLAIQPATGQLWMSVNERDELGDDLVPDYISHVTDGGFYGWPWFYLGDHPDPHHPDAHPELKDKVIVPDVLVQAHSASLGMTFYTGSQFPPEYRGEAFAAFHGSWNRDRRTGYKVIRLPFAGAKPTGEYIDFLTGFVTAEGKVWGRPVAVSVSHDGALLVSDDVGNVIWRVAHVAK